MNIHKIISQVAFAVTLVVYLGVGACKNGHTDKSFIKSPRPNVETPGTKAAAGPVTATLAPFDRFPAVDTYPLVFRFSQAVAPSDRTARENFSSLTISPQRFGSWRWESDSELRFIPQDGWKPKETLDVSLSGLKTSDGTVNDSVSGSVKFSPETFHVSMSEPIVSVVDCDLKIKNRAPLVQYPFVSLRLNYLADFSDVSRFVNMRYKQGEKEEKLTVQSFTSGKTGMKIDFSGPDLFRPEATTQITFELKPGLPFNRGGAVPSATTCNISTDAGVWDKLAESLKETPEEKPLVTVAVTAPTGMLGVEKKDYRAPLSLQFKSAGNDGYLEYIGHGKSKGLTLEKGVTLTPNIAGVWKTSEADDSTIYFTPKADWPVGTKVIVAVDANTFPDVRFKSADTDFTTPKLEARLSDMTLYTDPQSPTSRAATATLEFSHSPKAGEVDRVVSARMRVEPEKSLIGPKSKALKFSAQPDEKSPWKIYLRSETFVLPDEPGEISFSLAVGAQAVQGGEASDSISTSYLTVPSKRDIYQIQSASTSIVKREDDRLERVLSVEVTEPTTSEGLQSSLEAYLLPDCKQKQNKKLCKDRTQFGDEAVVFPDVLSKSEKIPLTVVARDEATLPNMFHFSYEAPGKREVFVKVAKGLKSETAFQLAKDYRRVLFTAQFPRQLNIMHQGSLLSLSSSRKLGVSIRGVKEVDYELARIMSDDVHHFVSVNSGTFQQPYMWGSVGINQLAEKFHYTEKFPEQDPSKIYYSAVDFTRFMAKGANPKGLFLLTVKEKADKKQEEEMASEESEEGDCEEGDESCGSEEGNDGEDCGEAGCESSGYQQSSNASVASQTRLVLLTDLGIVVKDALTGSHDVYVMSFRSGTPVAGASVKLLGQNGIPLFTATSDADGHVNFPPTKDLKQEKVPLVYVVEKGEDYSFLPFEKYDRELNFSRFETGGVFNNDEAEGLRAQIFSDRGIYRPGEEAKFGVIVRRRNLGLPGGNVPLEMSLSDPRGIEIFKRKFITSRLGFDDFHWSSEGALTGTYTLGIYLVREGKEGGKSLLGSASFRVDDFQPDKLNVKSRYVETQASSASGWSNPQGEFETNVQNLFGISAVGNTVKGTLLVRPWDGTLPGYPNYTFYSRPAEATLPDQAEDLGEQLTDANGVVHFAPDLGRFAERAYRVEYAGEAFEKDSGRSVVSSTSALVSKAPHFLGWKADGSLDYISKASGRKVSFLGVDSGLKAQKIADLDLKLEETKMISALIKQPNGSLKYQMTPKVSVVWTGKMSVDEPGSEFELKTDQAGDYKLRIFEGTDNELATVHYVVHGEGNTTFMADRNAEVGIQLKSSSVEKNEDLEISINTPYVGAGLITIERDKVYATKWFKTDTLSSVQHVKVPDGVVGNAYVSVAFVRSLDSKDIFAAPLSYGVKPFSIAKSEYTTKVDLTVPEKAIPGATLPVKYQLSSPGKFLLYAVDEGILQFAKYRNPDPVSSFVPKRALEVQTYQILDLLLPDYKIVSELASTGGDEDVGLGKFKNPFARKRRAPMAFWSGIMGDKTTSGVIDVPIPEYFNGTVRFIAVQVGERTLGVQTAKTVAQHDFVIDPQVPYFVSPGDEFEVGATIANTVQGSGKNASLKVQLVPSAGLELVDSPTLDLTVPESEDKSFRLKVKAKDALGEQSVKIIANGFGHEGSATETISLRPPQPFRTSLQAGVYRPEKDGTNAGKEIQKKLTLVRELYPEQREVLGSISSSPVTLGRALVKYLKDYPYGCTEQLVSVAFPAVLFGTDPEFQLSETDVSKFTKRAFQTLSSRQKADGSFGLWDITSNSDVLFSVYATHFLLEARERSLDIPDSVFDRAKSWLVTLTAEPSYEAYNQLAQVYALYLRARLGERVTKDAERMVAELDRQWQNQWRDSALSTFLAGTFKLLQMDKQADELLKKPPQIWQTKMSWPLSDASLYSTIYSWISTKHFPKDRWLSPLDTSIPLTQMIEGEMYNTFTSSFAVMGLQSLGEQVSPGQRDFLKIVGNPPGGPLELFGERILRANIPLESKDVVFQGKSGDVFFYETSETGFDKTQSKRIASGLTIDREIANEKQEQKTDFGLDEKIEVTLRIKGDDFLRQMAVLELVPGGFEIDLSDSGLASRKSLHEGPNTWTPDFIDIQEDRLIFFGDLPQDTATFVYRLKPLSRGKFTFGAPYAEGMYDSKKKFLGEPTLITVH